MWNSCSKFIRTFQLHSVYLLEASIYGITESKLSYGSMWLNIGIVLQILKKVSHTEFDTNLSNGSVVNTRSQTQRKTGGHDSTSGVLFLFVKRAEYINHLNVFLHFRL
jgi:hypothetical protein